MPHKGFIPHLVYICISKCIHLYSLFLFQVSNVCAVGSKKDGLYSTSRAPLSGTPAAAFASAQKDLKAALQAGDHSCAVA